jgi:protein TonB
MLTGRVPFERPKDSDSDFPVLAAHINQAPTQPSQFVPEIPLYLEAAILKALAKKPEERFQTCQEFQRAIVPTALPVTVKAVVPLTEPQKPIELPPEPSRHEISPEPTRREAEEKASVSQSSPLKREPRREPKAVFPPPPGPQFKTAQDERRSRVVLVGLIIFVGVILAASFWVYWPSSVNPPSRTQTTPPEEKVPPTQSGMQATASIVNNPHGPGNPPAAQARTEHSRSVTPATTKRGGGVVGSVPPAVPGSPMPGVTGSALSSVTPQPPPRPKPQAPKRIRVGGQVEGARLIFGPKPEYPPVARMARVQGMVRLDAVIGKDGTVQELKVISGHPFLAKAAMNAVKDWRYQPTLVNGESVEVATEIDVNFTLSE